MRRATSATLAALAAGMTAVAVLLGVLAQAATVLLEPPRVPGREAEPTAQQGPPAGFAGPGPHHVGVRRFTTAEGPTPLSLWYPARPDGSGPRVLRYATGAAMLGEQTSVAIATDPGRATPGAAPDRANGPYPTVVLSPGFALGTSSYAWLAEHLASYGLVVAAPQHAESLDPRGLWRATVDRPRDVAATLDFLEAATVPGGPLTGVLDPGRVAVVGHSYGGYTALAAAGARLDTPGLRAACASDGGPDQELAFQCDALVPHLAELAARAGLADVPGGRWPSWADPRVDAAVSLAGDAVMFGDDGLAGLTTPLLVIGGTADPDSPFRWGTEAAYDGASGPRKAELALVGAGHFAFTGSCTAPRPVLRLLSSPFCSDAGWDRQEAHDEVAHLATAFLLVELRGDRAARSALSPLEPAATRVRFRSEGY